MIEVYRAAADLQLRCEDRGWRFCLIGGISFLHHFGSTLNHHVPSYFQSLEHLLRSSARPPFALERLSVIRGPDGRISRIRYVLPRQITS